MFRKPRRSGRQQKRRVPTQIEQRVEGLSEDSSDEDAEARRLVVQRKKRSSRIRAHKDGG